MTYSICKTVLAGAMLMALGQGAVAGETKVSGKVVYIAAPISTSALAGGKSLRRTQLKGVVLADGASFLNLNAQDCMGTSLIDANGTEVDATGSCTASDKDGDTWSIWYHNTLESRSWTIIGGTGKFHGMTGSGTTTALGATADGRVTVSYAGVIQTK